MMKEAFKVLFPYRFSVILNIMCLAGMETERPHQYNCTVIGYQKQI